MFSNYKSQIVFFFLYSFFLLIISISIIYYLELRMESLYKIAIDEKIYFLQNNFELNLNSSKNQTNFLQNAKKFMRLINDDLYSENKIKFIIFTNSKILLSNTPELRETINSLKNSISTIQYRKGIKFLIRKYLPNETEEPFFVLFGISIKEYRAFQKEKWKLISWTIFTILVLIILYFIFIKQLLLPYKIIEKLSLKYKNFLRGDNDISFLVKVLRYIKDDMDIQNKVIQNLRLDLINEKFIGEIHNIDLFETIFPLLIYDYFEGIIFFNEEFEANFALDWSKIFRKKFQNLMKHDFFTGFLDIFEKETNEGTFE